MALKHYSPLEVIDLKSSNTIEKTNNVSLIKTLHLQLVRLELSEGHQMPMHHVPGEITLHCLSGKVDIEVPTGVCHLETGQIVVLDGGQPHSLLALSPSVVLLTLLHPAPSA